MGNSIKTRSRKPRSSYMFSTETLNSLKKQEEQKRDQARKEARAKKIAGYTFDRSFGSETADGGCIRNVRSFSTTKGLVLYKGTYNTHGEIHNFCLTKDRLLSLVKTGLVTYALEGEIKGVMPMNAKLTAWSLRMTGNKTPANASIYEIELAINLGLLEVDMAMFCHDKAYYQEQYGSMF